MSRVVLLLLAAGAVLAAQQEPADMPPSWSAAQTPGRLFGNVHYVGTKALSVLLLTSDAGHVLIDGALGSTAPAVMANVRALGFKVEDIRLIVNSHVHYDHAGGIGPIQQASGARVAGRAIAARVLESGRPLPEDPQFLLLPPMAPVANVSVVRDGETLRVGSIAITAHATGGHTPGGTSWSWQTCQSSAGGGQAPRCLNVVYADSLTAIADNRFRYTETPSAIADFEKSFVTIAALPCDVLLTPHPGFSNLGRWLETPPADGSPDSLIDRDACRAYAERGRANLAQRLAQEKAR